MTLLSRIAYNVRITGRVQGVCFREWTRIKAKSLNITGWVRNRQDGSVEVQINGFPNDVQEMLDAFEIGPTLAKVVSIKIRPCSPLQDLHFRHRSTV